MKRFRSAEEASAAHDAALVDRYEQQPDGSWAPAEPSPDPPREDTPTRDDV